ncbi:MAG: DUF5069 domain-containing protein [Candidatus Sericytochromatia bacterium]|nr:DUF5069 domain-containing protein [Candidatus Sericytochromatia bacterium]
MDLNHAVPRSPEDALDGYTWLPRLIDKARAKLAGTLGDYHYGDPAPMDAYFFEATEIGPDALLATVAANPTDAAVVAWVRQQAPLSPAAQDAYRDGWRGHQATTPDKIAVFEGRREAVAPGRPDIVTWGHLLMVEEGHG